MRIRAFYVVAKGHRPGIYYSHEQAKAAYEGFSGAKYESFANPVQALVFLLSEGQIRKHAYNSEPQFPHHVPLGPVWSILDNAKGNEFVSKEAILQHVFGFGLK